MKPTKGLIKWSQYPTVEHYILEAVEDLLNQAVTFHDGPPQDAGNQSFVIYRADPPTTGTYRLTFRGEQTTPINFDAGPSVVAAALELLTSIGVGNIRVMPESGTSLVDDTDMEMEFIGDLGMQLIEIPSIQDDTDGGLHTDYNRNGYAPIPILDVGQLLFDTQYHGFWLRQEVVNSSESDGGATVWRKLVPERLTNLSDVSVSWRQEPPVSVEAGDILRASSYSTDENSGQWENGPLAQTWRSSLLDTNVSPYVRRDLFPGLGPTQIADGSLFLQNQPVYGAQSLIVRFRKNGEWFPAIRDDIDIMSGNFDPTSRVAQNAIDHIQVLGSPEEGTHFQLRVAGGFITVDYDDEEADLQAKYDAAFGIPNLVTITGPWDDYTIEYGPGYAGADFFLAELVSNSQVFVGGTNPSIAIERTQYAFPEGLPMAPGSLFIRDDADAIYKKTGEGDQDWTKLVLENIPSSDPGIAGAFYSVAAGDVATEAANGSRVVMQSNGA